MCTKRKIWLYTSHKSLQFQLIMNIFSINFLHIFLLSIFFVQFMKFCKDQGAGAKVLAEFIDDVATFRVSTAHARMLMIYLLHIYIFLFIKSLVWCFFCWIIYLFIIFFVILFIFSFNHLSINLFLFIYLFIYSSIYFFYF